MADGGSPTIKQSVEAMSTNNLSAAALEVFPHLKAAYLELGGICDAFGEQETMITMANKIIRGEATEAEEVDWGIMLARLKGKLLSARGLTERQKTIRTNFMDKLRIAVIVTEQETGVDVDGGGVGVIGDEIPEDEVQETGLTPEEVKNLEEAEAEAKP